MKVIKKSLVLIPLFIIATVIIIFKLWNGTGNLQTAAPIHVQDSMSDETIALKDSLSASIHALDSLKPIVDKVKIQLKKYEELRDGYKQQEAVIVKEIKVDSSAVVALRSKLNEANKEISRLNNVLVSLQRKNPIKETEVSAVIQPAIITPDENSLIIELDGSSKKGELFVQDNLIIYLIPYEKKIKKIMNYDSYCKPEINWVQAKYYKGLYFF